MTRIVFIFTGLLVLFGLASVKLAVAEEGLIPGAQTPDQALDSIFRPVADFVDKATGVMNNLIDRLLDWNWLKGKVIDIFDAVSGWLRENLGFTLGEILKMIGKFLIAVFKGMISFLKGLFPF